MSSLQQLSSRQRAAVVAATGLILSLLLILLVEGGLRVRAYVKNGFVWGIEKTYTIDAATGLRVPISGLDFGSIQINSLGFRSPEISVEKDTGSIRLAFLGGSTTYSAEVSSPDLTWPHLVTQRLGTDFPENRFDYVNGGVPGYGINSSLKNLESRVKPLQPDVIVIYHATNDLSYNSFQLAVQQGIATERTEQQLMWISNYSLLAYLVEKNLLYRAAREQVESTEQKLVFSPDVLAAPFRKELTELVEKSQRIADTVALVTFSNQLRRNQDRTQQAVAAQSSLYYMPYMSIDGLVTAFETYNDVIREVAHQTGAVLIEAEQEIPGDPQHFADSVHLLDAGSKALADIVHQGLTESAAFTALLNRTMSDATTPVDTRE